MIPKLIDIPISQYKNHLNNIKTGETIEKEDEDDYKESILEYIDNQDLELDEFEDIEDQSDVLLYDDIEEVGEDEDEFEDYLEEEDEEDEDEEEEEGEEEEGEDEF